MTTTTLIQRNSFDSLLESGNKTEISKMLSLKETALINARTNMNFFKSRGQTEYADNEKARVELLERQIEKLKSAG